MANYPSSDPTIASLHTAVNNLSTALDGAIDDSVTTLAVLATAGFPTDGAVTIEAERITYTGTTPTTFTGCTRGTGGTTNVAHVDTSPVKQTYGAEYHNDMRDEVIAIAEDLRDGIKADLDDGVAPAATAADVKIRLDHFATQLKNVTGEADWKTAPTDTLSSIDGRVDTAETDITTLESETAALKQNVLNIIVNGGMEVWQRGTSFVAAVLDDYGADQWKLETSGGPPTVDLTRIAGEAKGSYGFQMDIRATGGSNQCNIRQDLENIEGYKNTTVTMSARVQTSVASQVRLRITDGVGATFSSYHTGGGTYETLSVTRTVSGSATTISLGLGVFDIVAALTMNADQVMLVAGDETTDYIPEDSHVELARCQRFYELFSAQSHILPMQRRAGDNLVEGAMTFKVEKSVTPTTTYTLTGLTMLQDAVTGTGTLSDTGNWSLADLASSPTLLSWFAIRSSANSSYNNALISFTAISEV